jgi:hypothetical protein
MMRTLTLLLCLAVAGCSPRPNPIVQGDPVATAALLQMPQAQFLAQASLAIALERHCDTLSVNRPFLEGVMMHNFGIGADQFFAMVNRPDTDLEVDVARRSLMARYGVDFTEQSLCFVADGEIARQAPISAILIQS